MTTEHTDSFLSNFAEAQNRATADQPAWADDLRKRALDSFGKLGIPTTKDEEWRFTSLRAFAQIPFVLPSEDDSVTRDALDALEFADLDCPRAVFVNGRFVSDLSDLDGLGGLEVVGLADALQSDDSLKSQLGSIAEIDANPFDALNTAFVRDGALIRVKRAAAIEQPIHLLHISTGGDDPASIHPRALIVAGENSQSTVIESHMSLGDGAYFTNPLTEAICGDGANVDHYKVQVDSPDAFNIGAVRSIQGRDASFATHTLTLGGGLVRNNVTSTLDGPGGAATLHAFYLTTGDQHVDNFTNLVHARENCNSREVYKGVLDDASRAVFHGRIVVKPDAQDTDSYQQNENLLLTKRCRVNTKPQLEIYADQVKCSHGATVGRLDDDALFYLRSRGISLNAAHSLLIYAFANEVIDQVKPKALREKLQEYLFAWLPQGDIVREAL